MFIISFSICLISVPILKRVAIKYNIMIDVPDERKVHNGKVPRNGGIGIAIGTLTALIYGFLTHQTNYSINHLFGLVSGGLVALSIGIYDDLKCISAKKKLLGETITALILVISGIRIEAINIPFWHIIYLPLPVSILVTILWIITIMNALNLIDGLDGLAAGIALIASIVIFSITMINGDGLAAVVTIALIGGCLGFLRYNYSPAIVFMGDSGSMFLGFILSAVSIQASYKSTNATSVLIPVMILGIPLLDTISAFVRRIVRHTSPFKADKDHIHHRLMNMGLNTKGCVIVLYTIGGILGAIALLASFMNNDIATVILIITGMLMVIGLVLFYRYTGNFPKDGKLNIIFKKSCIKKGVDKNVVFQKSMEIGDSPKIIH